MRVGDRGIGGLNEPYIVAEISGNHAGSLAYAKALIGAAKQAGADAVKTQCYEASTITLDCKKLDFIIQSGLWVGRSLHELYSKAQTPLSWHPDLYKVAHDEGITIFSSVFDYTSVDLLEGLGCPCYKIASFEIVDLPLIEYVVSTQKPIIISTGIATDQEVHEAASIAPEAAFLHCTSEYPGTIAGADLSRLGNLDRLLGFQHPIGISDHTLGSQVAIAATAMRATIIEKHMCLPGVESEDGEFSMLPEDFGQMVMDVRAIHEGMRTAATQSSSKQFRRSLYVVKDIKAGETFSRENVKSIRPGYGASPKRLTQFLGKTAKKDYRRGDPLQ